MRAEAQQAAGLNEQLAARAGVDRDKEEKVKVAAQQQPRTEKPVSRPKAEMPVQQPVMKAQTQAPVNGAGQPTERQTQPQLNVGQPCRDSTAADECWSTRAGTGTAADGRSSHAGGTAAAERPAATQQEAPQQRRGQPCREWLHSSRTLASPCREWRRSQPQ